ncbi:hypothetical protein RRG08_031319 [Elysia crispata]|uniref:Uncharacterized protein n=1 Tax=Elysia crispata TaxID=231223 RepID=A0AAE1CZA0_9GAST|nr:hypothetical protein RRG08_031319 [Elysia crispata]
MQKLTPSRTRLSSNYLKGGRDEGERVCEERNSRQASSAAAVIPRADSGNGVTGSGNPKGRSWDQKDHPESPHYHHGACLNSTILGPKRSSREPTLSSRLLEAGLPELHNPGTNKIIQRAHTIITAPRDGACLNSTILGPTRSSREPTLSSRLLETAPA